VKILKMKHKPKQVNLTTVMDNVRVGEK
jgi:hypothetical protein